MEKLFILCCLRIHKKASGNVCHGEKPQAPPFIVISYGLLTWRSPSQNLDLCWIKLNHWSGFFPTGILFSVHWVFWKKICLVFITLLFIILTSIYVICSFITVKCYHHWSPLVSMMITYFVGEKQLATYSR